MTVQYIDGNLLGEQNVNQAYEGDGNFVIGGHIDHTSAGPMKGSMDEFVIWSSALSADQIAAMYSAPITSSNQYVTDVCDSGAYNNQGDDGK